MARLLLNTPYQRRQRDWVIAAAIATVAAVAAGVLYLNSDIKATTVVTGPTFNPGQPLQRVPSRLAVDWQQPTDPSIGAAVSAFGPVVTADQHTVFGRDPDTGAIRWSYGRSNKQLCKVGRNGKPVPRAPSASVR